MGKKRKKTYKIIPLILVVIIVAYVGFALFHPQPDIYAVSTPRPEPDIGSLAINWPSGQEAAIGIQNYGVVASTTNQTVTPTASIAKIITALNVLEKEPLQIGQTGPTITISQADYDSYQNYLDEDGSVVKVAVGEQLSEYQALEGMLLPSGDNMADTLATWAFGSLPAYSQSANIFLNDNGLLSTKVGTDASGFLPSTVSTPVDLIRLGQMAMANPVLAQIVGQSSANLPIAGVVSNVNFLLNQDGVIGVKTGNTDQAGGCFLGAAKYSVANGQTATILLAIMHAPTLKAALDEAPELFAQAKSQLQERPIVTSNLTVARYKAPWGTTASIKTSTNASTITLPGMKPTYNINTTAITAGSQIKTVGSLTASLGQDKISVPLIVSNPISAPDWQWKLLHPLS